VLKDGVANDVRRNGTHSSGTDDDRVLRALVRNEMCWLRYCGDDVCRVLNVSTIQTPEGWKAELAWLTHSGQFTHRVVACQPQIGRRAGKARQTETDVLTTEPRRQTKVPNKAESQQGKTASFLPLQVAYVYHPLTRSHSPAYVAYPDAKQSFFGRRQRSLDCLPTRPVQHRRLHR